jgi:hypothetical protein
MLLLPKLSFRLKKIIRLLTHKYSLRKRREKSAERKSFDASDMLYLIMPDRFANGNQNDSDATTKEKYNRDLPGGRHGGDIQGIIKLRLHLLLEQQRSGAHRYVKIMTKRTPITPMLNLMFILTPLRNKC